MFSVVEGAVCPVEKCEVRFNAPTSDALKANVKMVKRGAAPFFDLQILQDEGVKNAYQINSVSVKCSDKDYDIETAEFNVVQNEDSCWTAMIPQTIGNQDTIAFARNTPWFNVNDVMKTKDSVNCPITSCKLLKWTTKTIGILQ